jgi:hypothetical protein
MPSLQRSRASSPIQGPFRNCHDDTRVLDLISADQKKNLRLRIQKNLQRLFGGSLLTFCGIGAGELPTIAISVYWPRYGPGNDTFWQERRDIGAWRFHFEVFTSTKRWVLRVTPSTSSSSNSTRLDHSRLLTQKKKPNFDLLAWGRQLPVQ